MRFRNKTTGMLIGSLQPLIGDGGYSSIQEFNNVWEDCEEPESFWYITEQGGVKEFPSGLLDREGIIENYKRIGNYFKTKEEAEKAVDRLTAWRRLKDKDLLMSFCSTPEYSVLSERWECAVDFSADGGDDADLLFILLFGDNDENKEKKGSEK